MTPDQVAVSPSGTYWIKVNISKDLNQKFAKQTYKKYKGTRVEVVGDTLKFEDVEREYALMGPGRGPVQWVNLARIAEIEEVTGGGS